MKDTKKIINDVVSEIINQLGVNAGFSIAEADNVYTVSIRCTDDPSILIGKHAEGLLALQRIIQIILFKKLDKKTEILVDINDYRERQKERLASIANNIASRVTRDKRPSTLRSFNAYERKIIHEYISNKYPNLKTYSEGEEPARELIVALSGGDDSITALEEEFDSNNTL